MLAELLEDEAWREQAACRGADPSIFFPRETTGPKSEASYDRARAICSTCPVRGECLDAHLFEMHGCFAGTSPLQRRRLRRERGVSRGRWRQ